MGADPHPRRGNNERGRKKAFVLAADLAMASDALRLTRTMAPADSLVSAPSARAKPREDDDTLDCFSTHPFRPLRVRAVVARV